MTCLLCKLKSIKILNFTDEKDYMGKAKYILKNGRVLEKLAVLTESHYSEEEKLKIFLVLSALPRESKQCCILVVWCKLVLTCYIGLALIYEWLFCFWFLTKLYQLACKCKRE